MSEIVKAVYVTLKKGFHKTGLDIEKEFATDFSDELYKKAQSIVAECEQKGIRVHKTRRSDLPPVLYLKGDVRLRGKAFAFAGPSVIDEKTEERLSGFIKALNLTSFRAFCGDRGQSEEIPYKTLKNPITVMYDGNFDAYTNAVSEFYPGVPSKKEYFKYRNELMIKLCDCLVFTEIKDNSRSNKILEYAQKLEKEVVILTDNSSFKLPPLKIPLPSNAALVYNTFADNIMDYESLLNLSGLEEDELTMALFTLTIKGVIKKAPMNRYEIISGGIE